MKAIYLSLLWALLILTLLLFSCERNALEDLLQPDPRIVSSRHTAVWNGQRAGLGDELQLTRIQLWVNNSVVRTIPFASSKLIADCNNDLNTFHREVSRELNELPVDGKFIFHTSADYFDVWVGVVHMMYLSVDTVATFDIEMNGVNIQRRFNPPPLYSDSCASITPYDKVNLIGTQGLGASLCEYEVFALCLDRSELIIEQWDDTGLTSGDLIPIGSTRQSFRTTVDTSTFYVNVNEEL